MLENATQRTWQINASSRAGGNKRLRKVESSEIASERSKTATNEMGSTVPTGVTVSPGPVTISLTIRHAKSVKPEVDWWYLEYSDEWFTLTSQIVGGRREQFGPCQVSSISESSDSEGEHTYTVEILALERKPL